MHSYNIVIDMPKLRGIQLVNISYLFSLEEKGPLELKRLTNWLFSKFLYALQIFGGKVVKT